MIIDQCFIGMSFALAHGESAGPASPAVMSRIRPMGFPRRAVRFPRRVFRKREGASPAKGTGSEQRVLPVLDPGRQRARERPRLHNRSQFDPA